MIFSKQNLPPGYYVYLYLREDGTPYYCGKGFGNRAYRKGSPKNIKIVAVHLTEQEAFILEKYLIKFYGRKDLGTGILRNFTNGGEGTAGIKHWWAGKSEVERFGSKEKALEVSAKRVKSNAGKLSRAGKNNGMYGRSAVTENKLEWYSNGAKAIFVSRGAQPNEFIRGRHGINSNAKLYCAIDPDKNLYTIPRGELHTFCQEHNLTVTGMREIARTNGIGKRGVCTGWQCRFYTE